MERAKGGGDGRNVIIRSPARKFGRELEMQTGDTTRQVLLDVDG